MKELICTITFVLFSFTLASAKQQTNVDQTKAEPKNDMTQGQDQDQVNLMEIMSYCNESFRIEMSYIQALNESGSFPDETNRTPKCYVRCMVEKSGVASEDGVFDAKMAAMVFGDGRGGNKVEDLAQACTTRDEQCKCERAYQFLKCFMEKEIEEYGKSG